MEMISSMRIANERRIIVEKRFQQKVVGMNALRAIRSDLRATTANLDQAAGVKLAQKLHDSCRSNYIRGSDEIPHKFAMLDVFLFPALLTPLNLSRISSNYVVVSKVKQSLRSYASRVFLLLK
jgi:hypothetical protein